eukprot:TRINITY_DN8709_c0_g1_i2.p1 TRINITY_DN8709_c0_g1~~TRINITY_DN8709_c0_g1_i2.p1  ORF type:complete len:357 (-),score=64.42 TRINITY_DN8709_c0_g1_i2:599-1669(-)
MVANTSVQFSQLPFDILSVIIAQLPESQQHRARLISKQLRDVVQEAVTTATFYNQPQYVVAAVLKRYTNMRRVKICYDSGVYFSYQNVRVPASMPTITHLRIYGANEASVLAMASAMPNVESVRLFDWFAIDGMVLPRGLPYMSQLLTRGLKECLLAWPRLRKIRVALRTQPQAAVTCIAEHAPNLESLYLDLMSGTVLTSDMLSAIAEGCPRLRSLTIDAPGLSQSQAGLQTLVQRCAMQHLMLDCVSIDDHTLRIIARNCPQLRYLAVHAFSPVSGTALNELALACPHLELLRGFGEAAVMEAGLHDHWRHDATTTDRGRLPQRKKCWSPREPMLQMVRKSQLALSMNQDWLKL